MLCPHCHKDTEKQYPRRSLSQNNLLHAWFHLIAVETGNTDEDVKNAMKDMMLPLQIITVGNKSRMIRKSTAALTKEEMTVFMDRIMSFAATELGITLPTVDQI